MPTNRTPKSHKPGRRITPQAIAMFSEMLAVEDQQCSCEVVTRNGTTLWSKFDCPKCKAWWELHDAIAVELRSRIWEFPTVERPDTESTTAAERLYVRLKKLVDAQPRTNLSKVHASPL